MINLITSKALVYRLYLMYIILMRCLFTSENAFSMPWEETFNEALLKENQTIIIKVQCYYFNFEPNHVDNFLKNLVIEYSEKGSVYTPLISTEMQYQGRAVRQVRAKITFLKHGENITYPNISLILKDSIQWLDMELSSLKYRSVNKKIANSKYAHIEVKWRLPYTIETIKNIRIKGIWCDVVERRIQNNAVQNKFLINFKRPIKKVTKKTNKNVKVTRKADIVSVTGVNTGEIIKVYNDVSGEEVNFVIAKGDVVDIRLQKNQNYIIKLGLKSIKVAL